jgi:hypothetical protein
VSDLSGLAEIPLPVGNYESAAPHLRRPFTPEAVKWKVQAGSLVVPYIDARLVIERLNIVVPALWYEGDERGNPPFESIAGGNGLLCRLSVGGITRCDVGSGYKGKGLYSDAFKRAAVKFGVGVSLYALPKVFLNAKDGQLREAGKSLEITDKGRARLDGGYRKWLEQTGEPMFGPVLDHGDIAGALGDVEAEVESAAESDTEPAAEKLTDAKASGLIAGAEALYQGLSKEGRKGLPAAAFRRSLESAWHSHEELEKLIAELEKRSNA